MKTGKNGLIAFGPNPVGVHVSGTQLANGGAQAQRESVEGINHSQMECPECLESWKDIAVYLKRDVRTVQRWEKSIGLPVHRLQDSKSGSVYAHTSEIDGWRRERALKIAREKLPVIIETSKECGPVRFEIGHKHRPLSLIPLLIGLILGAACNQLLAYVLHPSAAAHSLGASSYTAEKRNLSR